MTQPALMIIRAWQEKSLEVSNRSKDRLITAVTKGFDAMAAVLAKDSDPEEVQCSLEYLSFERSLAFKHDKAKDDSLREVVYGLLESLHVSLIEWTEERKERKETGEISRQIEDESTISLHEPLVPSNDPSLPIENNTSNDLSTIPNPPPSFPIEPKEETIEIHESLSHEYLISASELMRDEKMLKEEEMDDENNELVSQSLEIHSTTANFTRSLRPFNLREEPADIAQSIPADIQAVIQPLVTPLISPLGPVPIDYVHPSDNASTIPQFTHSLLKPKKEEPIGTQEVHDIQTSNLTCSLQFNSVADPTDISQILPGDDRNSGMNDRFGNSSFNDRNSTLNFDDANYGDQYDLPADSLIDNEEEMKEEEAIVHSPDTQKDISDSDKVEKRKRSSRLVSKPVQYNESMEDSDGDDRSSMKKPKRDYTRIADNNGTSCKGDDESESGNKRLVVSKKNNTELECPECEHRTRSVGSWIVHLRKNHSTTPALAGLALLCECGHESLSQNHRYACNGNTTVISKRDGPIRRIDDKKDTPQCVLCEAFPRTAFGYAKHISYNHKSTLTQNGIYLTCSCGIDVRNTHGQLKHQQECDPCQFSLHKLD